ncbi:hypothetical protein ACOSQ3_016577 [Xanthoceras sorbifolium]
MAKELRHAMKPLLEQLAPSLLEFAWKYSEVPLELAPSLLEFSWKSSEVPKLEPIIEEREEDVDNIAPVRNVEVKEGAHPSDSGGKFEKAAVPDLASSNGSNLEQKMGFLIIRDLMEGKGKRIGGLDDGKTSSRTSAGRGRAGMPRESYGFMKACAGGLIDWIPENHNLS